MARYRPAPWYPHCKRNISLPFAGGPARSIVLPVPGFPLELPARFLLAFYVSFRSVRTYTMTESLLPDNRSSFMPPPEPEQLLQLPETIRTSGILSLSPHEAPFPSIRYQRVPYECRSGNVPNLAYGVPSMSSFLSPP